MTQHTDNLRFAVRRLLPREVEAEITDELIDAALDRWPVTTALMAARVIEREWEMP